MTRALTLFLWFPMSMGIVASATLSCTVLVPDKTSGSLNMVPMPEGDYWMGDVFFGENTDAIPTHEIHIPSFYLMNKEVSFDQFDAFAERAGLPLPDDEDRGRGERAVVQITWEEADAFCRAYGLRLPTEPEWEYAARSGGGMDLISGSISNDPDSLNRYTRNRGNSVPFSAASGTKAPNQVGLFDMSGNVFEWIGPYYQFYRTTADSVEWVDLSRNDMRVIRGGSYREESMTMHTYWRVAVLRDTRDDDIGFRCAGDQLPYNRPRMRLLKDK